MKKSRVSDDDEQPFGAGFGLYRNLMNIRNRVYAQAVGETDRTFYRKLINSFYDGNKNKQFHRSKSFPCSV